MLREKKAHFIKPCSQLFHPRYFEKCTSSARVNAAMFFYYLVNLPLKLRQQLFVCKHYILLYSQKSFTKLCLLAEDVGSAAKSVVNVS